MLTSNPNIPSDWLILAQICKEKGVDMFIIIKPEKYRDDVSAVKRATVLREAHDKGVTLQSLQTLCPMTDRGIRKAVFKRNSSAPVPASMLGNGVE